MRNLRPIKFTLRLSQIESDKIQSHATEQGIDKADYIRDRLFGKEKSSIPPVNYRTYSLPSVELDIKQRNTDESNRAAKWQKV